MAREVTSVEHERFAAKTAINRKRGCSILPTQQTTTTTTSPDNTAQTKAKKATKMTKISAFFQPKRKTRSSSRRAGGDNGGDNGGDDNTPNKKQAKRKNQEAEDEEDKKEEGEEGEVTSPRKRIKLDDAIAKMNPRAKELLETIDDHEGSDSQTWKEALITHFKTPSFARLSDFVATERKNETIFPPPEDTFSALNLTPLDKVKVVIVGQDPYHGEKQAHGLCFSVGKEIKIPPSLRNMYKELINDKGVKNFTTMPTHGFLERWAKQGVLMLNTVLTVRKAKPFSHKKKGWEDLTDEILRAVDKRAKDEGRGVVFLLWGTPATKKINSALVNGTSAHEVIASSHPSPLGATKTNAPFMGSCCFSRANAALKKLGYDEQIDWRVDGPLGDDEEE